MAPVGSVGAPRIGGACRFDVIPGTAGERVKMRGQPGILGGRKGRGGRLGGIGLLLGHTAHFPNDVDDVRKIIARNLVCVALGHHGYSFPPRRKPASKEASGWNRDNGRSSRLKAP